MAGVDASVLPPTHLDSPVERVGGHSFQERLVELPFQQVGHHLALQASHRRAFAAAAAAASGAIGMVVVPLALRAMRMRAVAAVVAIAAAGVGGQEGTQDLVRCLLSLRRLEVVAGRVGAWRRCR